MRSGAEVKVTSPVEALDRYRYLSLATYRASGAEVATPVWFAAVESTLYVFTAGDSGKVKRLRRSPRARVAPCDARGTPHGAWRDATARLVTDAGVIARAQAALRAKYGWQKWLLDLGSRLTGRIRRRAWIAIVL
jgi:PPOX class probable F420-dependent enzyme